MKMGKFCMNPTCRNAASHEWKSGWRLRSGRLADLCYTCGYAYENLVYCETFHSKESGWRKCHVCSKNLHCGCIASQSLLELLDHGGVCCIGCSKAVQCQLIDYTSLEGATASVCNDDALIGHGRMLNAREQICHGTFVDKASASALKQENGYQAENIFVNSKRGFSVTGMNGPLGCPSWNMTLQGSGFSNGSLGGGLPGKGHLLPHQAQNSRPIFSKPSKSQLPSPESNKIVVPDLHVARPPAAEGRGKNQLLPRYWPRITDQELQQLSGDLNSNIVPLFEKVLSASDAGRIGRLVLPKACAEAYFPPISQSEGLPLRIQDTKGREWMFQFRFWPNNNSRMYVLEGVTPCIQSLQLQAGDTVTFSRIDPGGKFVMGYRKAANSFADSQEIQAPESPTDTAQEETSYSGALNHHANVVDDNMDPQTSSFHSDMIKTDPGQQLSLIQEKKRTRNIGTKSKRLHIHIEDALELKLTWEEVQDLLRPPPNSNPSIISIDGYEFEEYDEPPVFGKRTVFAVRSSGEEEQWAQCDDCSKWRKVPLDALLPPNWTCSDNTWGSSRSKCAAPEEKIPKCLVNLLQISKNSSKKACNTESQKPSRERDSSPLDALASVAVLGDNNSEGNFSEPSVGATTKHPRHRPGCSCIVCIQPPSGKGKHDPECGCNVCTTVRRRFKTLMLRKKKRQVETGPETTQLNQHREECGKETNQAESNTAEIDLNCDPDRARTDVSALLSFINNVEPRIANENDDKQACQDSCVFSQDKGERSIGHLSDEAFLARVGWDKGNLS